MLLDLWFHPDGRLVVLDEEEVEECFESGLLTAEDRQYIEESKKKAIEDFAANARKLRAAAG